MNLSNTTKFALVLSTLAMLAGCAADEATDDDTGSGAGAATIGAAPTKIQFEPNKSSSEQGGNLPKGAEKKFTLSARQGQVLAVECSCNGGGFTVDGFGSPTELVPQNTFAVVLPKSGDFTITVKAAKTAPNPFKLTTTIKTPTAIRFPSGTTSGQSTRSRTNAHNVDYYSVAIATGSASTLNVLLNGSRIEGDKAPVSARLFAPDGVLSLGSREGGGMTASIPTSDRSGGQYVVEVKGLEDLVEYDVTASTR